MTMTINIAALDAITNNWLSNKVYMIISQQVGVWYFTLGDLYNRYVASLSFDLTFWIPCTFGFLVKLVNSWVSELRYYLCFFAIAHAKLY